MEACGGDEGDPVAPAQEVQDLAPAVGAEWSSRVQQDAHQRVYVSRSRRNWLMDFTM